MCDFSHVRSYPELSPEQRRRFDAHARGEDGRDCHACREKYVDPEFYRTVDGAEAHPQPTRVAVVGAGYVGLSVSACLAKMGHDVICVENDGVRLAVVRQSRVPFYEPGLSELVANGVRAGTLGFTDDLTIAVETASIVFIAVGTPLTGGGIPDLSALHQVTENLARYSISGRVIAIKSTVPVGSTDIASEMLTKRGTPAAVAYNPEFLREGSAVDDFFHPSRIIIGTYSPHARRALCALFEPLHCPIFVTSPRTAEMIKYGSNAFLATRVSFINELAAICEEVGADVEMVAAGMGLDPRIGPHFLRAGIGFGGSCLPKDLEALMHTARRHGIAPYLLEAVRRVNREQQNRFVEQVARVLGTISGKTLTIFGLAFKPGTSDTRESPALTIAVRLRDRGAFIRVFDPACHAISAEPVAGLNYSDNAYEAAEGADAVLLLTDWSEFVALDWHEIQKRVRQAIVIDGRNMPIADRVTAGGFTYFPVGRVWTGSATGHGRVVDMSKPSAVPAKDR